jgi:hypothetical protein
MRTPMGPGGEEHRGRERGKQICRLWIEYGVTFPIEGELPREQATTANAPLSNHATQATDTQLPRGHIRREEIRRCARRSRRVIILRKPTHPPGDRNVSRVSLEFSYSTGVTTPGWGGEVTLHWKGPERDPTCCLRGRSAFSRSHKSQ